MVTVYGILVVKVDSLVAVVVETDHWVAVLVCVAVFVCVAVLVWVLVSVSTQVVVTVDVLVL